MQLHVNMRDTGTPKNCNFCGDNKTSVPTSIYKVENWIQSCQNRCPEYQNTSPISKKSKKRLKSKSKSSIGSGKSAKSVTFSNIKVGTTLKSTSMVQPCIHYTKDANFPVQMTTHLTRIDNPPNRTCSCSSNCVTNKQRCIKSHQLISRFNPYPIQQVAQRVSKTRVLLSGLKTELNKVKSQLTNISLEVTRSNASAPSSRIEREIYELKLENVKLKKELDTKRQQCERSLKDAENAKRILNEYEDKVVSLHDKAMESSRLIKQSKEKFCKCLKEKELEIEQLKQNNENLIESVKGKDAKFRRKDAGDDDNLKTIAENSRNFTQCVQLLEKQLENAVNDNEKYKDEVRKLEQQILNYECKLCQKYEQKVKKQKIKLNNKIKEQEAVEHKLMDKINELNVQLEANKNMQKSHENLQNKYKELENQLKTHEDYTEKYTVLNEKHKEDIDKFKKNEEKHEKDKKQLRNLVNELTTVVKQNKITLLQLSEINKQQERLLLSQTSVISEKNDKIKLVESEIEILKKRSSELQEEVEILKRSLKEPCKHESHLILIDQLREIRKTLNEELDNRLIKEKIIEDQTETITTLQNEIKDKISELNRAREENGAAEEEISSVNEDLSRARKELEEEIARKEILNKKCEELEIRNSALSVEVIELENLIENRLGSERGSEIERLQREIVELRRKSESERAKLRAEKEKAVEAAQFATQKLLDTVNDFQKQVGAQKKVQCLLTKMLHDKEDDLRTVHRRLDSINTLATGLDNRLSIDEIFRGQPDTSNSYVSSCSRCSRELCRSSNISKKDQMYNIYITDEENNQELNY
ncbi:leucine-rich repeat and coiled-coil domain-containing protein 1-like [Diorhabda carinulata]|uniref:leucine-rich repeat and coiled-coil domain-containing protein 1-like n=1 Tax=Diorhabda carinulata TaxID=1163345 RepID=UPI0025A257D9|nr:leucine-rich repeat and coiled-coil domain-containing protein 1-like [Diorhabda carinulata]